MPIPRRFIVLAATAIAFSTSIAVLPPEPASGALPTKTIVDDTPRPHGPVTVIGDSVLLGSLYNSPTIVARLAEHGWGPIRAQAGGGYSTGAFAVPLSYRASYWIQQWRRQGWDPPHVIVNIGANDSGFCRTDTTCAYNAIMHLVNAIGDGSVIWWPKITRFSFYQNQAATWNAALDRVAAERPYFFTWDWPTVMANGPFPSSDNTHLSPDGYRLRSAMMAETFTAVTEARPVGSAASLPPPIGEPTEYVPLLPDRIVDTRMDPPGPLAAGGTLTVDLTPYVPNGATAVAVNLTSAGTSTNGFLTAHPCDRERRQVSSVNHAAGTPRGALAIVPLSSSGELCVYTAAGGHVVVDLQGAFVPENGSGFTPVDGDRLVDTRETGRTNPVEISIDDPTVEAVAVNLTAVNGEATGFLTADACEGDQSEVSNVNFRRDEPVAGAAIVPVSDDGRICIWSSVAVDVVVDLTGEFRAGDGLRFQPADPTRMLDVRDGTGGWATIMRAGQLIGATVAPPAAAAVTGTITLVGPTRTGYAVADCRDAPPVSNVNALGGDTMANSLTVAVADAGKLCFRSSTTARLLFDTTGWWVP